MTADSPRARLVTLRDGRQVTVRAVKGSDEAEIVRAFDRLSADSKYLRFMVHQKKLNPAALEAGLHPVPGRAFVFVATVPSSDGYEIVGAAQYVPADDRETGTRDSSNSSESSEISDSRDINDKGRVCEFAITLAEAWRGSGLAVHLLASLVRRSRRDGYRSMEGHVIAANRPMLALARKLRFEVAPDPADATVVRVERQLAPAKRPWRVQLDAS